MLKSRLLKPNHICLNGDGTMRVLVEEPVLGLSSCETRVLSADVALGAGGRLEGHGATGALVEHLAMSRLNVGLDGV